MKLNYLGIFQSLKLRISLEKILSISLNLNFTVNTLGCYGLKYIELVPVRSSLPCINIGVRIGLTLVYMHNFSLCK